MNEQRIALRQRRDLSELLQSTIDIYRLYPGPFLTVASIVVPVGIAAAVFQNPYIYLSITLLQILASIIAGAAIMFALVAIESGQQPSFSDTYDAAFERLATLLGAQLRSVVIVMLLAATIIGIPWAIQRLIRWLFVLQAVVFDGTDAKDALSKSAEAVEGRWWRTFGIALLVGLLASIPTFILATVLTLAPPLISGSATSVASAVTLPFGIIAMTLLYFDLQLRKESDDHPA